MACRELSLRRLFISSKRSSFACSCAKACTTFWLPIISSTNAVCSALSSPWRANMECVRLAMKRATKSESGVSITTASVIGAFTLSMNMSVHIMVSIPVKSWLKPSSSPSANWSTSAIMRLTVSP